MKNAATPSGSVVLDTHHDPLTAGAGLSGCGDVDVPVELHGLRGVDQEVLHDLGELTAIAPDGGQGGVNVFGHAK